jgi:type IV secretory pathway VirB4 component
MPSQTPEKKPKLAATQKYLPIDEIREGVVVMKNKSVRAVIMISSVNFSLKSEEEKNAMIIAYQNFLNSLTTPIQVITRSRQLHLDEYLDKLQKVEEQQTNELLRLQTTEYIQFVAQLLQSANVMEKRFFVVVPYYPVGTEEVGFIKKLINPDSKPVQTDFETTKMALMERVQEVMNGLTSVGLRCVVLNTEDLIELYYTVYNPDTSGSETITDSSNLESPIITSGSENAQ